MLDLVTLAVSFFLVSLITSCLWMFMSFQKPKAVPGLEATSKEYGNLGDVSRAGSLHKFLLDLHGKFGPIAGFWWDTTYVVSTASPQLFKEQKDIFDKPLKLFRWLEPIFGSSSMQFRNGSEAKTRRRNYDRAFAHKNLPLYCPYFQKVADNMLEKWLEVGPDDQVPLTQHVDNYALRCTLGALLGKKLKDEDVIAKFKVAHSIAWDELDRRQIKPVIPASDDNSPEAIQLYNALKTMESLIKDAIEDRKERRAYKPGYKLIDIFIDVCPNDETICNEVVTYVVGAFHTTGNALTWVFYYLALHKDVQDKLYKEIIEVLGIGGVVTESNFPKLQYMMQVINETNRLAIIGPSTSRIMDTDCELGGYKIPKNTPIIQALGVVLHDEKIWPSPEKFDPDRFSKENMVDKTSYSFPAFGFAGKRQCPGNKFALWEEAVLLATLIGRFEIRMAGDHNVQFARTLVTYPKEEIWLKIAKRQ